MSGKGRGDLGGLEEWTKDWKNLTFPIKKKISRDPLVFTLLCSGILNHMMSSASNHLGVLCCEFFLLQVDSLYFEVSGLVFSGLSELLFLYLPFNFQNCVATVTALFFVLVD